MWIVIFTSCWDSLKMVIFVRNSSTGMSGTESRDSIFGRDRGLLSLVSSSHTTEYPGWESNYYYLDELMSTWITGILLGQNIVMAQSDGNEDEKMWMRKKNNKKAYLEPDLRMFTGWFKEKPLDYWHYFLFHFILFIILFWGEVHSISSKRRWA